MASEILTATIDNASIHRLRTTLKRICERSFIAHDLVGAELLAADASDDEANAAAVATAAAAAAKTLGAAAALAGERVMGGAGHGGATNTPSPVKTPVAQSKKRRFPRYAECGQCGDEYDVTDNRDGDCVWHDGIIDTEPFFLEATGGDEADWDQFLSDCEEGRADYSLYCRYTCCKRQSEAEGCSVGTHSQAFRPVWVDTTPKKKRARR